MINALFGLGVTKERSYPMIQFMLTDEERELLIEILENDKSDLRMEIANTDRLEYRTMLKNREVLMKSILQKLEQTAVEKSAA